MLLKQNEIVVEDLTRTLALIQNQTLALAVRSAEAISCPDPEPDGDCVCDRALGEGVCHAGGGVM